MAGLEVASLFGVLSLRDDATAGLRSFDNSLAGLGDRLGMLGSRITGMGASLGTVFLPLAAGLGAGIAVASDFDSVMAEIGARTGLTGEALESVRAVALQMGADTAFSAQQAADSFLQLLTSGQSVEDALLTLSSGMDLGRTADTVTDIMAAFRLPVHRAASVVDALARASGASSATMEDLAQGFANSAGKAAGFEMSVAETAATLAVFSENGIKGAEAGTQLRSMLTQMGRNTEDVSVMWESLGSGLYDAAGNARNLQDVIDDLNGAVATMTDEERNTMIQTLAGSYGAMGLQALLSSGGIDTMMGSMEDAASAGDVAAARMETFEGRVDSLKGSIETLAIVALTPLMNDVLKPLAEQLTTTINGVTEWASANPELTTTLAQVVIVGAGLSLGLIVLGTVVSAVGTGIGLLAGGVALLTSGALLPLLPVLFVIGGMFLAYQNNVLGFKDRVDELGVTFRKGYDEAMQLITAMQTLASLNPLFFLSGTGALIGAGIGAQQGGSGVGSRGFGFDTDSADSADRRKSSRGGGDNYVINVAMPPGATRATGQAFGEAIYEAMRRSGGAS